MILVAMLILAYLRLFRDQSIIGRLLVSSPCHASVDRCVTAALQALLQPSLNAVNCMPWDFGLACVKQYSYPWSRPICLGKFGSLGK